MKGPLFFRAGVSSVSGRISKIDEPRLVLILIHILAGYTLLRHPFLPGACEAIFVRTLGSLEICVFFFARSLGMYLHHPRQPQNPCAFLYPKPWNPSSSLSSSAALDPLRSARCPTSGKTGRSLSTAPPSPVSSSSAQESPSLYSSVSWMK